MTRESLDMYRRTVGNDQASVARGMNNLAMWLMEDQDFVPAEQLLRDALELRIRLLGPEHADSAASTILLADLCIEIKRYAEALELAVTARAVSVEVFGPDDWRIASAASAEGAALAGLQRFDEAEVLLLQGFEGLSNDDDAKPYFVSSASRWLAQLYRSTGRPNEAAKYAAEPGN